MRRISCSYWLLDGSVLSASRLAMKMLYLLYDGVRLRWRFLQLRSERDDRAKDAREGPPRVHGPEARVSRWESTNSDLGEGSFAFVDGSCWRKNE